MFKVIESKDEFFAAARAGLLWGNYQTEEAGPPQWEALEWGLFGASLLYDMWAKAEKNRKANPQDWRSFDFAILIEDDDGEGDSPIAGGEGDG